MASDGTTTTMHQEDIDITVLDHWYSAASGARYPSRWRLRIASLGLHLDITLNMADQEMRTPGTTNVTYWEGSVRVAGRHGQQAVEGVGYVELTGYAAPFDAPL